MSKIIMRLEEKCKKCNGKGKVQKGKGKIFIKCPVCEGEGVVKVVKELDT